MLLRFDAKILGRGFGYDIRGTDGPNGNLTPEGMYRLGKVLGGRLPIGAKVFVSGDARPSSALFRESLIKGYRESGINVVTTPSYLPTGIATWYIIQHKFNGSAVVSGSHNPRGQNGVKMTEKGKALYGKELASLEEPIVNGLWRKNAPLGRLEVVNDIESQFSKMLGHVFPSYQHPHRIFFDAADGIGGLIKDILEAHGAEVDGINLTADGTFPTYGQANPSKSVCTDPLIANIKTRNSQLKPGKQPFIGLMLDGDADRFILVSEKGVLFEPEKMAAIFYREYLRGLRAGKLSPLYGPHMALDVRATRSTTEMVVNEGGIGYYIQAGYPAHREWADSIIPVISKDKVTGTSAEASGHFFEPTAYYGPTGETYPDFASALVDDGFFLGMRMMSILDQYGYTVDQLMAEIPSLPFAPEKRAKVDGSKKFEVMAQMPDLFKQAFSGQLRPQKSEVIHFGNLRIQHPDNGLITVDGVKALLSDGASALTRASNTGDELSFIFEAPSYKRLAEVMSTVIGILKPFEKSAGLDLAELVKQYEGIQVKAGQEA